MDTTERLTVEQYHALIRAGILTTDDKVELLGERLVTKARKSPAHSFSTHMSRDELVKAVPAGWHVETHEPFTTEDSEPEPDVLIVRGEPRDYPDEHPGPANLALVVEIADATLQQDRTLKQRLYAKSGIVVYWILNLIDQQLEVYTEPSGTDENAAYQQRTIYQPADTVALIIEGQEVAQLKVSDLLP